MKPNIVFVLVDNTGWGDFGCYGGATPTPRIDELAAGGIRFNNYTVEAQCTPTRSAILTGRQSVRSGTFTVPLPGHGAGGLAPWEYTIANLLSDAGYATALYGKWHCGDSEGRLPTDQGFDEWWGFRNSADECGWTSYATFEAIAKATGIPVPMLWEGKKGGEQHAVRELNMEVRPLLDELIVGKATAYIKRQAAAGTPFFTFVGLSHIHPPEAVHPDFDQASPHRLGMYADIIAEMDYRVGQIVDCINDVGIADNTVFVLSSDNGPGEIEASVGGSSGPFRGSFFTPPWEGCMRVPAIVRWPGKVPEGVVTEEMLACHDWYATFAALAGALDKVPADRPLDSIDVSRFLLGQSPETGRHSVLFFGPDGELMSVKWRNVKAVLRYCDGVDKPILTPQFPMFFDLGSDPQERYNLFDRKLDMGWMFLPVLKAIGEFDTSIARYPNIKPGQEFKGYATAAGSMDTVPAGPPSQLSAAVFDLACPWPEHDGQRLTSSPPGHGRRTPSWGGSHSLLPGRLLSGEAGVRQPMGQPGLLAELAAGAAGHDLRPGREAGSGPRLPGRSPGRRPPSAGTSRAAATSRSLRGFPRARRSSRLRCSTFRTTIDPLLPVIPARPPALMNAYLPVLVQAQPGRPQQRRQAEGPPP